MHSQNNEFRNRRQQFANEIRRQNRQQILGKRRNISHTTQQQVQQKTNSREHIIDNRFADKIRQFQALPQSKQQFLTYLSSINDSDILKQHFGVIGIRKLLTQKNSLYIQEIIDAELVPKLIAYAKQTEYPQLQLQSVWCLTNVAAGSTIQTGSIIDKGGLKIFVNLLLSEHLGIVEQAIWVIGNIACDSPSYRNMIIKCDGHKNLIKVIEFAILQLQNNPRIQSIIEIAAWSLAAICRTKPQPNYMLIKEIIVVFFYLLNNNLIIDVGTLGNVCWAIFYNTNNKKEGQMKIDKIQNCIDSGIVPKLIQYFNHSSDAVAAPSVKIIGNLATGNRQQVTYLLNNEVIPRLQQLLYRIKKKYSKESCLVFQQLVNQPSSIQPFFSRQSLINKMIKMTQQDTVDIKIQIFYTFSNAIMKATKQQVQNFVNEYNLLRVLAEFICQKTDTQLLLAALECLRSILQVFKGDKSHCFIRQLYQLQVIPQLEKLQLHEDDRVYNLLLVIVHKYFELENIFKQ